MMKIKILFVLLALVILSACTTTYENSLNDNKGAKILSIQNDTITKYKDGYHATFYLKSRFNVYGTISVPIGWAKTFNVGDKI